MNATSHKDFFGIQLFKFNFQIKALLKSYKSVFFSKMWRNNQNTFSMIENVRLQFECIS